MFLKMIYILLYLLFFTWFKKVNTLHAWCTPGGAIAYIVSIFTGKPLVLDSFEPHAETMVEGGTWNEISFAYRLLFRLEKLQLKRAREVICAAPGMIAHSQQKYGIKKQRYFVKSACVDLNLFNYDIPADKKLTGIPLKENVCVYAGKFGGIYLEREVFDFFKACCDHWKGNFTVLLLTSHSDEEIQKYCDLAGLPLEVVVKRFVTHREVPLYMELATFGFCPVKPLPSKQFCTPIKNGEYWAMGLPVVITANISTDSDIIQKEDIGYVLNMLSASEYKRALKKLDELKQQINLKARIRQVAVRERNFETSALIYRTIYA